MLKTLYDEAATKFPAPRDVGAIASKVKPA
jgi:hypothetical protein